MKTSPHEQLFIWLWQEIGGEPYVREKRFDDKRKWRIDFYWELHSVGVEIEGGSWSNGRHTRGSGFQKDIEKYNRCVELGIRVLRYTGDDLRKRSADVLEQITRVLNARQS